MVTHQITLAVDEASSVAGEHPTPRNCVEVAEGVDPVSAWHQWPEANLALASNSRRCLRSISLLVISRALR